MPNLPVFTDRFSLCVTPGPKQALVLLLAVTTNGGLVVARAAERSASEPTYAAQIAAQLYAKAREHAPVAAVLLYAGEAVPRAWLATLRLHLGARADLAAVPAGHDMRPGTWGAAVRGAAAGAGVMLERAQDAVTQLARECRMQSVGSW